ncbi:MAG: polysaccharide deacetylase family protein [Bacteroidota bacterium]|nr:polysaccharide deacetylase family protein [Bacteroidota bacterium]
MKQPNKLCKILLGFDIEEFDLPVEYGCPIPFDQQIKFSGEGTVRILSLLKKHGIHATFFCTASFVENAPEILHKIVEDGHEIASHGYHHSKFEDNDYADSKQKIEQLGGVKVSGFRMPRMHKVNFDLLKSTGYIYDSSLNPTFIPGRYNHLNKPRLIFEEPNGIIECPSVVTPLFRIPLFWLSFHNFFLGLYLWLFNRTLQHDGYAVLYFHPWEFIDLKQDKRWNVPFYIQRHAGEEMAGRLDRFIQYFASKGTGFETLDAFLSKRH